MRQQTAAVVLAAFAVGCAITGPPPKDDNGSGLGGDGGSGNGGDAQTVTTTTTGSTSTGSAMGGMGGAGGAGGQGGEAPVGGNGQMPPMMPVYRVPMRIHRGDSGMTSSELGEVLNEIQWIWWSQAAICFEVEVVDHEDTMNVGYDMWFVVDPKFGTYNGYYSGDHDIWTVDDPSLGSAPNPTDHPASRTGAHELGHGLELSHYNGQPDSNDSLMSSGKRGWKLHDFEIETARGRASEKALEDEMPIYCAPITVE